VTVHRYTPLYRVWDPLNQTEQDAADRGWDYGALSVACAAELHVEYRYQPDEFASRNFPIMIHVRELDTGKLFEVSVDRRVEFRFCASDPEAITYPYIWRVRTRLPERFGTRCRVTSRGKLNNVHVVFEDGFEVITSRNYLRKAP